MRQLQKVIDEKKLSTTFCSFVSSLTQYCLKPDALRKVFLIALMKTEFTETAKRYEHEFEGQKNESTKSSAHSHQSDISPFMVFPVIFNQGITNQLTA